MIAELPILLLAGALEGASLSRLDSGATPAGFLALHATSSVLVGASAAWRAWRTPDRNLPVFAAALWAFFPGVGPALAVGLRLALRGRLHPKEETMEVLTELIDSEKRFFRDLSFRVVSSKRGGKRAPLEQHAAVLRSNDFEAKRRTISALRADRGREAIALLQAARRDPAYEVQYLATVALTAIEQELLDDVRSLSHAIELNPSDLSLRNEILNVLVSICSRGLVPENIARIYLDQALEHVMPALLDSPDNPDFLLHLGKIRLLLGDHRGARDTLAKVALLRPTEASFRLWLAEASYYLHDLQTVREQCELLANDAVTRRRFEEQIEHWRARA